MLDEQLKAPAAKSPEETCLEKTPQNGTTDAEFGDDASPAEIDRIYR